MVRTLRFVRDYHFTPPEEQRVTIFFRAGKSYPVRKVCAERALADGAAVDETPTESAANEAAESNQPG